MDQREIREYMIKVRSRIVKGRVKQCKLKADEELGARVLEHNKGKRKLFWREVSEVWKNEGMVAKVKDWIVAILVKEEKV